MLRGEGGREGWQKEVTVGTLEPVTSPAPQGPLSGTASSDHSASLSSLALQKAAHDISLLSWVSSSQTNGKERKTGSSRWRGYKQRVRVQPRPEDESHVQKSGKKERH